MAVIQWGASPSGHYSENSIAISSQETFYLNNGSYNDKTFPVTHIGISAAGNSAITVVTFSDGSSFTVSPFTNSLIEVAGRESCIVVNDGDAIIKVTLMDFPHAKAYGSQYTQPPWQAAASLNELLYHFSENPIKNYGYDKQALASLFPSESLSTTGGIFSSDGYVTGNATKTAGIGFSFTNPLGNQTADAYTIDMWVRAQGIQPSSSIIFIGTDDNAAVSVSTCLLGYDVINGRWVIRGTASLITPFPLVNGVWNHVALVKVPSVGNTRFYLNGILQGNGSSVLADSNLLYLQTKTAGGANDNGFNGDISEFRYTNRAVWLSNFTPPTAPYT